MPIVKPTETRIYCSENKDYSIPMNILMPNGVSHWTAELMDTMALYQPDTRFREGDIALLLDVPKYLAEGFLARGQTYVPRVWKIRFVITEWAWDLMVVAKHHGGEISSAQAVSMLEAYKQFNEQRCRRAMIFGTGYPHGEYNNTAHWLPEQFLKRTIRREGRQSWYEILEEALAEYKGYDTEEIRTGFTFDLEPSKYADGRSLGRPFKAEEPLVHTLHLSGLGPWLENPYKVKERDRLPRIDPEHDIFAKDTP